MAAVKWTPQQESAIFDRGGTLLLSAAAGSGKTAVLTQRAVEMIADEAAGIAADRLLIVTFTNAAAAELRTRLAAALDKKLAATPDSLYLKRQQLLLGRASICTVDSYCIDLLRRHADATYLPGDFTVIKEAEAAELSRQAMDEALESAYEDPDFRALSSLYGRARSDDTVVQMVQQLYDISRAMDDPEGWWSSLEKNYTVTDPVATDWGRLLLQEAGVLLEGVLARMDYAIELAEAVSGLEKYAGCLQTQRAAAGAMAAAVAAADWDALCAMLGGMKFDLGRAASGTSEEAKGRIKNLRDAWKKQLEKMRDWFCADRQAFAAEAAICRPMMAALVRAVRQYAALLQAKKLEAKAFGFDDFEHAVLALLQDEEKQRTPLSLELGEYYAMVMVDEYQDTNDLQDRLYQLLAKPDGSNLFFVGDVKQSIYGFRHAKPENFIAKRDSYAAYDGQRYPAAVLLCNNFRSTPSVLAAINDIFVPLMRRAVGGVDYAGGEALVPGGGSDALPLPVQLLLTDTAKEDGVALDAKKQNDDSATVALAIRDMLEAGAPVRDGEGLRPCRPGDFCILLRSPGSAAARYVERLEAMGIGVSCQAGDDPLEDLQVQLLLAFLRVLDNPGLDVELATVMLSPVCGFVPDDLVELRLGARHGCLYAALLQQQETPKFAAFLELLQTLRRRSIGMPIQDVCAMLLEETGLYRLSGALSGGESSQRSLRAFQAAAAEYAGSGGLAGFLRLVDACRQEGRPFVSKSGAAAPSDRVRIMSIHGSKGLEFSIVFLANCAGRFNEKDLNGTLLCHRELGAAFRLQDGERKLVPTLALQAIKARMKQDAAGEEMRLLYVALTRARDRLYLSWAQENLRSAMDGWAMELDACGGVPDILALTGTNNGFARWLSLALLSHPDGGALRELCGWEELGRRMNTAGHFAVSFHRPLAQQEEQEAPERTAEPQAAAVRQLLEGFAAPVPAAAALPVKVSVSALSHKNLAPVLDKPAFLYKQGMTAAQKGTALHLFLQVADLAAARKDPDAELARLIEGGYIAADQAAGIEMPVLRRFLESELVGRMLGADTLLREYEFISCISADMLPDAPSGEGSTYLLGIADCIILQNGEAELVDYKTDHGKSAAQLLEAYATQLALYRRAIRQRLGVPVRRSVIYSFALGREIEVPE